jgi:hypothetical protein
MSDVAPILSIAHKRMWSTTFPSNFGSAFLFLFFFFKIEPLAVTFQTANGQAIAQRDEIDERGPAIRPINRSQTGRQSIVFHLLGLLLSVCSVPNDLNPEVNDFNDSTLPEESCCATTSGCKCELGRMETAVSKGGKAESLYSRTIRWRHPAGLPRLDD